MKTAGKFSTAEFFQWINPGHTFALASQVNRRTSSFWSSLAITDLNAWLFLALAAWRLPKYLPLLMTAAGTIRPARVVLMGAGVASLQAIATA